MSIRAKLQASAAFILALLLYLFFDFSKHQPALAQVNAFAEDPYDAVGSFGIQFAFCTALLALVRAFRPYATSPGEAQELLFAHTLKLTWIGTAVVLGADVLATLRYSALWLGTSAGNTLTELLAGLVLLTALVAWFSHTPARAPQTRIKPASWITAACVCGAFILVMLLYPQSWRQDITGALLTALTGLICFFVTVWAWTPIVAPDLDIPFEDSIDDLVSIYRWWRGHLSFLKQLSDVLEKARAWPFIRWLNPRRHPWNGVILLGVLMGLFLALAEAFGENGTVPHLAGRFLAVTTVFVGFECLGVVLGYFLIARSLGLFRREPPLKAKQLAG